MSLSRFIGKARISRRYQNPVLKAENLYIFAGTPNAFIFSEFANQIARGKWNLCETIVTISFSE
jgi:hypothetical protein